jgi:hypothetical protein
MTDVHGALAIAEALRTTMTRADDSAQAGVIAVTPEGGAVFSITTPMGTFEISVSPATGGDQ